MFSRLASQPVADDVRGPLVLNAEGAQTLQTTVFGVAVNINFDGTEVSTLLAETGMAAIEACFATAFELDMAPHTERFDIEIIEDPDVETATFIVDEANSRAVLRWRKNRMPTEYRSGRGTTDVLTEVAMMTMAATCMIRDGDKVIERLAREESVLERISVVAVTGSSYHRLSRHTSVAYPTNRSRGLSGIPCGASVRRSFERNCRRRAKSLILKMDRPSCLMKGRSSATIATLSCDP
jgi:hypothetical protein